MSFGCSLPGNQMTMCRSVLPQKVRDVGVVHAQHLEFGKILHNGLADAAVQASMITCLHWQGWISYPFNLALARHLVDLPNVMRVLNRSKPKHMGDLELVKLAFFSTVYLNCYNAVANVRKRIPIHHGLRRFGAAVLWLLGT